MSLITSRGNLKSQSITNEVLIDKRAHRIVKAWQRHGFPFIEHNSSITHERYTKFMKVDDAKSLDFANRTFKFNNAGLALAWSYHPEAFGVEM